MVAHSMELDELLFSSFFMDHGNNNEAKTLSSNIGKTKMIQSTSLSDFDSKVTMDGLHIVYGMIDNTGYISFDINWIRLQFKISLNKVQYRLRYGDSSFTAWTTFSA